nr:sugar ABC transporter permease [Actinomycetales bacterium]
MSATSVPAQAVRPPHQRRRKSTTSQTGAGWLFVSPVLLILGLFLVAPILMSVWISLSDWSGRGAPLSAGVNYVGLDNFQAVLTDGGLSTRDFGTSLRNNVYYVLLVVPIQTAVSLVLAVLVNQRLLRAKGFFRTAFYFPSITSSVAITTLWLFLFSISGVVNKVLAWFSITGPNWFNDPRGLLHLGLGAVGVESGPAALTGNGFLGISWWEWLSGPSVAWSAFILMAIFTTTGTFMLLFIAALQQINGEVEEAAMVDGANAWQRFTRITVPMLKPTIFTVVTLGLIGTWQVFDQIYVAGQAGGPAKTTLTPAYLSYSAAFTSNKWGQGAAISFILFFIILAMAGFQRWLLRDKDDAAVARRERKLQRERRRAARAQVTTTSEPSQVPAARGVSSGRPEGSADPGGGNGPGGTGVVEPSNEPGGDGPGRTDGEGAGR